MREGLNSNTTAQSSQIYPLNFVSRSVSFNYYELCGKSADDRIAFENLMSSAMKHEGYSKNNLKYQRIYNDALKNYKNNRLESIPKYLQTLGENYREDWQPDFFQVNPHYCGHNGMLECFQSGSAFSSSDFLKEKSIKKSTILK